MDKPKCEIALIKNASHVTLSTVQYSDSLEQRSLTLIFLIKYNILLQNTDLSTILFNSFARDGRTISSLEIDILAET